jgi:hypothetical protein
LDADADADDDADDKSDDDSWSSLLLSVVAATKMIRDGRTGTAFVWYCLNDTSTGANERTTWLLVATMRNQKIRNVRLHRGIIVMVQVILCSLENIICPLFSIRWTSNLGIHACMI